MARGWPRPEQLSILALSPHFWQLWFMSPRILYCLQATARSKHVKCKAIFGDVRQYMRAPTKHLKNLLNTILNGRCCLHLEWGFGDTSLYQCALYSKHSETLLTCMVGRRFLIVVFSQPPSDTMHLKLVFSREKDKAMRWTWNRRWTVPV